RADRSGRGLLRQEGTRRGRPHVRGGDADERADAAVLPVPRGISGREAELRTYKPAASARTTLLALRVGKCSSRTPLDDPFQKLVARFRLWQLELVSQRR